MPSTGSFSLGRTQQVTHDDVFERDLLLFTICANPQRGLRTETQQGAADSMSSDPAIPPLWTEMHSSLRRCGLRW